MFLDSQKRWKLYWFVGKECMSSRRFASRLGSVGAVVEGACHAQREEDLSLPADPSERRAECRHAAIGLCPATPNERRATALISPVLIQKAPLQSPGNKGSNHEFYTPWGRRRHRSGKRHWVCQCAAPCGGRLRRGDRRY